MSRLKFIYFNVILAIMICATVAVWRFSNTARKTTSVFVPEQVVEKSNRFLISKMGKDSFDKYITLDPSMSYRQKGELAHYNLGYVFQIPEKPFVKNEVSLMVSVQGNFIYTDSDLRALPNCSVSPQDCNFPIDETRARKIAEEKGFEKGIEPWKAHFHWDRTNATPTYVWSIINTFENFEHDGRAKGKNILINAHTGSIVTTTEWMAIQ